MGALSTPSPHTETAAHTPFWHVAFCVNVRVSTAGASAHSGHAVTLKVCAWHRASSAVMAQSLPTIVAVSPGHAHVRQHDPDKPVHVSLPGLATAPAWSTSQQSG
jgi:hypothetical protein